MADETIETPAPTVEIGQFVRVKSSNVVGRVMAVYGDVARVTWPLDRIESDHAAADLKVVEPKP
jgi:hypothetical protein